jgi:hypothetical protein
MKHASRLTVIAGAALLPFAVAVAQDPSAPAPAPQQGASFESLDADSDGKISKVEASVNENVSQQFGRYDKNGDGFIERSEVNSTNAPPVDSSAPPK